MSPELLDPDNFGSQGGRPTKLSDCYALGMVIFEVFSGKIPFEGYHNFMVIQKVTRGEHPARPEGALFTDDLWETLEQCWSPRPNDRPTVEGILERLGRFSVAATSDPNVRIYRRLISRTFSQDELPSLLGTLFSVKLFDMVQRPQGGDAQVLVDVLDEARRVFLVSKGYANSLPFQPSMSSVRHWTTSVSPQISGRSVWSCCMICVLAMPCFPHH